MSLYICDVRILQQIESLIDQIYNLPLELTVKIIEDNFKDIAEAIVTIEQVSKKGEEIANTLWNFYYNQYSKYPGRIEHAQMILTLLRMPITEKNIVRFLLNKVTITLTPLQREGSVTLQTNRPVIFYAVADSPWLFIQSGYGQQGSLGKAPVPYISGPHSPGPYSLILRCSEEQGCNASGGILKL